MPFLAKFRRKVENNVKFVAFFQKKIVKFVAFLYIDIVKFVAMRSKHAEAKVHRDPKTVEKHQKKGMSARKRGSPGRQDLHYRCLWPRKLPKLYLSESIQEPRIQADFRRGARAHRDIQAHFATR